MVTQASRPSLSVVIAAKNEAANIADCVASAQFADEIVVLDSGSNDDTAGLATRAGARVVQTDWPGYGPQQARAIQIATKTWIFSLDADERITPELQAELLAAIQNASPGVSGFWVPRISQFCGQFIHHSGWRPDHTLRLALRSKAGFTQHFLHAHMTVDGETRELLSSMLHFSYPTVSTLLEKLDRYSSGSATDMAAAGKQGSLSKAIGHGLWAFVRTYVFKRGFLDGRFGLMLAIYNAEYAYYKYIKLMFSKAPPLNAAHA